MKTTTFRTFALIGAVGAFAAACSDTPTTMQPGDEFLRPSLDVYTMTDSAQFDTINGAQWSTAYVPTGSVGTGVIRPFLDMASQDCKAGVPAAGADNENGFNTDNDAFVYCQHRTTDTNKLPLNYIPVLVEGGTAWREFVLDGHESDGSFGIAEFEVYICGSTAAITYQTKAQVLAGCTEIYDIGPHTIVATDQYSSGSGNVFDYRILVPNAAFVAGLAGASCPYNPTPAGETACGKYVIVWSKMTGTGSTFEEYSTILRPAPGTLQLKKIVVNDNGGTAGVNDFGIVTSAPGALVWDAGVTVGSTTTYTSQEYQLSPGSYTFSEQNVAGYSEGTWSCTGATATGTAYNAGSVTVADELTIVCQITNNDIAPALTLNKITSYSNGGTRPESDWTLIANKDGGAAELTGPGAPGSGDVISGSTFQAGTYALSETGGPYTGYQNGTTYSCVKNGGAPSNTNSISLAVGDVATCSITNTDVAGSLQLKKIVINDNGGTGGVSTFSIVTNAGALSWDSVKVGSTTTYTSNVIAATGAKTFSEANAAGYLEGTWSCTGATASGTAYNAGGVTVPLGTAVVCEITNNDAPPKLTLNKITSYTNGGTRPESDWTLVANKDGGAAELTGAGAAGSTDVVSGATFQAGTYALSETGGPYTGYANGTTFSCVKNGGAPSNTTSIVMAVGDTATCSITNTDVAGSLQLKKIVINDNGGTGGVSTFSIVTNAGALSWDSVKVGSTTTYTSNVMAGTGAKTFSEANAAGYLEGTWSCTGATASGTAYNAGGVTIPLGTAVVCEITNNDAPPKLTLNKITSYSYGGTRPESDWTLNADKTGGAVELTGPGAAGSTDVVSGATFQAGTYALSETGSYTGYQNGTTFSCVKNGGAPSNTTSIVMAVGDTAACSITNTDLPGSIKIIKNVVGTGRAFTFNTTGTGLTNPFDLTPPDNGQDSVTFNGLSAGNYSVTEVVPSGYLLTGLSCTAGGTADYTVNSTATIVLPLGGSVTCTYENTEQSSDITRTQGFWQTHLALTEAVWFGGTVGEHTFPGIDPEGFCVGKDFDTIGKVMGGFWSNIAKTTTNGKRSDLDQARMRLAQQLLAAILNNAAFASFPSGDYTIAEAKAAFCGTDIADINGAASAMAAFNESGDSELFTPGVSANAKEARAIANLIFWNILP